MDLKSILNEVLGQSGFLQKGSFAGSTDVDDIQMVSIANRAIYEIKSFVGWSIMKATETIVMTETGGVPDTRYELPVNFFSMTPDSVWETDGSRKVELPVPEGRWFMYKYTAFSDGGTIRARIYGNEIEIHDPEPGESFNFEYIIRDPIIDSGGDPKERFTADSDSPLIDNQLVILGIQAHWSETKMLPQAEKWMLNFRAKMNEAIGRDSSGKTIGGNDNSRDWLRSRSPYYPLYR